ncbi:hypothetical protein [Streptomyces sp. NPDC096193]
MSADVPAEAAVRTTDYGHAVGRTAVLLRTLSTGPLSCKGMDGVPMSVT